MEERTVAKTQDIPNDNSSLMVDVDGVRIGIYGFQGSYYAYQNNCPHQGGPAPEGGLFGNVECQISPNGNKVNEHVSKENMNIVCPWHGVEYDLKTGICRPDKRLRLRKFEVTVDGDELKITV